MPRPRTRKVKRKQNGFTKLVRISQGTGYLHPLLVRMAIEFLSTEEKPVNQKMAHYITTGEKQPSIQQAIQAAAYLNELMELGHLPEEMIQPKPYNPIDLILTKEEQANAIRHGKAAALDYVVEKKKRDETRKSAK